MEGRVFLLALCALVGATGCTSDEAEICQRLAECNLLPEGYTQEKCEAQSEQRVPDERKSDCADCVVNTPCREIVETCRADCRAQYD